MTSYFRVTRRTAVCLAIVALVAVASVAIGLMPEPVSSGALGPDWQCTRLAFVFTSCSHVVRFKTAAAEPAKAHTCPRQGWRNVLGLPR